MAKVVCFENLSFNSHIHVGSHHYAKLFSRDFEVLWVSLPFHFLQLLKDRKSDRFADWNYNRPIRVSENLQLLTPFTFLPYRNAPLLSSSHYLCNYRRFMPGLMRNLGRTGFGRPDIAWVTDPRHISLINALRPKKIYYRCVDNLEHFADIPKSLLRYEKELVRRANGVFFTSRDLMAKFGGLNDRSYYLPNGCDFDDFSGGVKDGPGEKIAAPFFRDDKINLLYTGAVAEWFDFDFLLDVSRDDRYNIIIVGPIRTTIPSGLADRKNVVFTGPFPYEMIPSFTRRANVALIPFRVTSMTDSVNPIKLYEYCAAGVPVVASAFKTLRELDGPFFLYGEEPPDRVIAKAFEAGRDPRFAEACIEFAYRNSWSARYQFIKKIITEA